MHFLRKLFGLKSNLQKKKELLVSLKARAEMYERSDNSVIAASLYHEIEMLETEIEEASK